MLSATLDSNTYISALNFGGTPLEVLNLSSDAILEEFADVLPDKVRWRDDDIADAQQEIRSFANHVMPAEALTVVRAGPDGQQDSRIRGGSTVRLSGHWR